MRDLQEGEYECFNRSCPGLDFLRIDVKVYVSTSALNIFNISSVLKFRLSIELSLIYVFLAGENVWEQFDEVSAVCSFPFCALFNRVCSRPRAGFVWDKPKFNSRWLSPQCQLTINPLSYLPFSTTFAYVSALSTELYTNLYSSTLPLLAKTW